MQTIGYIMLDNRKVLVLVQDTKIMIYIKIRKSGSNGTHFKDEEVYLNLQNAKSRHQKKNLLSGKTIRL